MNLTTEFGKPPQRTVRNGSLSTRAGRLPVNVTRRDVQARRDLRSADTGTASAEHTTILSSGMLFLRSSELLLDVTGEQSAREREPDVLAEEVLLPARDGSENAAERVSLGPGLTKKSSDLQSKKTDQDLTDSNQSSLTGEQSAREREPDVLAEEVLLHAVDGSESAAERVSLGTGLPSSNHQEKTSESSVVLSQELANSEDQIEDAKSGTESAEERASLGSSLSSPSDQLNTVQSASVIQRSAESRDVTVTARR
jgi:hypothetical protein